ncbi:MAG: protein-glutamate O-methyltransferase CheR [Chitinispirillales bacterium]|nr:protein-glutamate O-methyltransferase CheR [Chitinispirillales bacterium]
MDKKTFDSFRELIYDKSGITLSEGKEALVAGRVGKRLRALQMETYKEYLQFLTGNSREAETEFVQFLDVISTNVTSFFRESDHFDLMGHIVQEMVEAGQNKVRIWCAASSSGEEPYTIAMTFLENAKGFRGDCRILATDISTDILSKAVKGEYVEAKMNGVSPQLRTRYFTSTGMGQARIYKVNPELSGMIKFARLNLSKPPFPMKGPFDIIFCRNVMIYFDNVVRKNLIAEFERLLKPGGYLMVAHSESIAGLTTLRSVKPSVWVKH